MVHATIKNKKYMVGHEATNKKGVAQDVARNVARNLHEIILEEIKKNDKVTRNQIAMIAKVSKKTIEREIKKLLAADYAVRMYEKGGFKIVDGNAEEYIMGCEL